MHVARVVLSRLTGELGATDCEALDQHRFVSQPVNAASSLAYLVAGAWVLRWALRHPRVATSDAVAFAVGLGLVGLGSVDFHGPQTPGARFVHDASIGVLVLWMALFDVRLLRGWSRRRSSAVLGAAAAGLAASLVAAPDSGIGIIAVAAAGFVVAEILVFRTGTRAWHEAGGDDRTRAYVVAVSALVIALVLNVLGRTDAPLCDPDGWFQGHGAWHVLSAVAFAAWGRGALPTRAPARTIPA